VRGVHGFTRLGCKFEKRVFISELEKKLVMSYARAMENFSDEAKAELIRLLSKPAAEDEKTREERFYSSFGGWNDMEKTTEEIIAEIRGSRKFRDKDLCF
jgi:hypothetical protein